MYEGITQTAQINTPAIVDAAGTALAANVERKSWSIQNCDTDPLFVRLGGAASATVFHYVLKGGTGADDGTGGSISESHGCIFTGLISVAGTTPRFVVRES
jgi:hypothetical protein